MSLEYGIIHGTLRWIRNPFSGTVTYFTNIRQKPHAFRSLTHPQDPPPPAALSPAALQAEMARVQQACVFCPGNEHLTTEEVLRLPYAAIYGEKPPPDGVSAEQWALRVVRNLVPRIPEDCTGGRNESYVLIEDARHFLPQATSLRDLMWSGALPPVHFAHVMGVAAEVVQRSLANPAVRSVLIRKHQGKESGASQPHIHLQIIGADRIFPDVEQELAVTARQPGIWEEIAALMHTFGFHLEAGDGIVSYWSPFGKFSRHFEIVSLRDWQPLHRIPPARLRRFAQYAYRLLRALGTAPYDLEIHHGEGIPLHLHLNGRRYVYANIGGTLNAPVDAAEHVVPPTREAVQRLAQEMAAADLEAED
ncbi:MAG: hypothetical protein KatS3mg131_2395 [Candidatus Tectimicrobiota bacterium]|nr:MAG: hypothetical protein KatS3mg131_2395 [Candidatus Tectomicrobia bacterium]